MELIPLIAHLKTRNTSNTFQEKFFLICKENRHLNVDINTFAVTEGVCIGPVGGILQVIIEFYLLTRLIEKASW